MVYSKCCSSFGKVSVDKESAYPSESSIHQQEKTKSQERKLEYPNSSLRSEHKQIFGYNFIPFHLSYPYHCQRLGDPYGSMLEEEVVGVEEHSTGEEVGSSALRGKPRKLVVRPKEGAVLVGRWVDDDTPLMASFGSLV